MAGILNLEVATPDRLLLKEQVSEVEVPASNGALGILPEHAPLLSELGSGTLTYTPVGATKKVIAVNGGWVEVLPDRVRVLAERAEFGDEIDMSRAEVAMKRALERLTHPTAGMDVARAMNAMHRAQSRLEAAKATGMTQKK
ncbi:MAG: ATP synthase F1 subunit epsilon [Candidatus Solibacter sp.]|nr:ATP synthase F1 subunit epsilon [Candidatus Solibacter sp.]